MQINLFRVDALVAKELLLSHTIYYSYLRLYYRRNGFVNLTEEKLLAAMINTLNHCALICNNPNNCNPYKNVLKWFYYVSILSGYPSNCVKNIKIKY